MPDWDQLAGPPAQATAAPTPVSSPQSPPPAVAPGAAPKGEPIREFTDTWVGLAAWCRMHGVPEPARLASASTGLYEIRAENGVLQLRVGSQLIYWSGLELHLGFAPQLNNGQLQLHGLDLSKSLQPLLAGGPGLELGPRPTLVLDPGHGGENAGTRSVLGNHYEKEFTLDVARRLQSILNARGAEVFLTRSGDYDLALSNRVAFAEEHKADLFLSLHFNSAAPSQNEAGLETYCLTPAGMPSSLTRGFADEVTTTFPNNAFDAQNLQLALRIHRALLEINGHHDRGIRRARFPGILRGQQRPAILVEAGYLSNPQEARLIGEADYRERLAEALARALLEPVSQVAGQQPNGHGKSPIAGQENSKTQKATGQQAPQVAKAKPGEAARPETEAANDDTGPLSHSAEIP